MWFGKVYRQEYISFIAYVELHVQHAMASVMRLLLTCNEGRSRHVEDCRSEHLGPCGRLHVPNKHHVRVLSGQS